MEDALLLEEMAEEDDELDLYNEMTFGLGKTSGGAGVGETCQHPEGADTLVGTAQAFTCPAVHCFPPLQDRDSTEEDVPKFLEVPEINPEVAKALVEATGRTAEQLEELAEEEGGIDPEVEQVNFQLEEEVEELGAEEQEDDQECFEEPGELGDPAVMRAVRSQPTLEVMYEWTGDPAAPPSLHTPVGPVSLRQEDRPFNSPFLAEPGLSSAGQQD